MCQKRLITVKECCQLLNIGKNTMYKICKQKNFPRIYVGNKILIDVIELSTWIKNYYGKNIL